MNHQTKTTSSALDQYLEEINPIALLTVDEEQRLARGDPDGWVGGSRGRAHEATEG
jgi:hypothetical protein